MLLLTSLSGDIRFATIKIDSKIYALEIYERQKKLFKENSLLTYYPELAREWHPNNNNSLKPDMFSYSSTAKIWWMCSKGHEWQAAIRDRVRGNGCPICAGKVIVQGFNDLASIFPTLAEEWHPTKNGKLKPTDLSCGSTKLVWWICPKGHEYQAKIYNRVNRKSKKGTGCPYCFGNKILEGYNDLKTWCLYNDREDLLKEWHKNKNGNIEPKNVTKSSSKKIWWKCLKCGNDWQAYVYSRTGKINSGCPYCSGRIKAQN